MTEAMPFLQKAILLSYAPRSFGADAFLRGKGVRPKEFKMPLQTVHIFLRKCGIMKPATNPLFPPTTHLEKGAAP